MRKHGDNEEALLVAWRAIDERIGQLEGLDERRAKLSRDREEARSERQELGDRLAKARAKAFVKLAAAAAAELAELGMPKAKLSLAQEPLAEPGDIGDVVLVVDAAGRIEVQIDPPELARRSRGIVSIDVTNIGLTPAVVHLDFTAPDTVAFAVPEQDFEVAPGTTRRVPARVTMKRQIIGRPCATRTPSPRAVPVPPAVPRAHSTRKTLFAMTGVKALVLLVVVAVWATLAVVLIPKLADKTKNDQTTASNQAGAAQKSAQNDVNGKLKRGGAASSGAGGSGSGGSGSGGSGAGGSGSSGSGGSGMVRAVRFGRQRLGRVRLRRRRQWLRAAADASAPKAVQFSGTVGGDSPGGVTVAMRPTSLVDGAAQGAHGVGVKDSTFTQLGKIPEGALTSTTATVPNTDQTRNTSHHAGRVVGVRAGREPGLLPGHLQQARLPDAALRPRRGERSRGRAHEGDAAARPGATRGRIPARAARCPGPPSP